MPDVKLALVPGKPADRLTVALVLNFLFLLLPRVCAYSSPSEG